MVLDDLGVHAAGVELLLVRGVLITSMARGYEEDGCAAGEHNQREQRDEFGAFEVHILVAELDVCVGTYSLLRTRLVSSSIWT